mmetsp:Transcript_9185/g.17977  ORF Transcript_9185/g.17977 Transcript_9185/m.17977 type:complete len:209 (-) Transcript_9185:142-768(-)
MSTRQKCAAMSSSWTTGTRILFNGLTSSPSTRNFPESHLAPSNIVSLVSCRLLRDSDGPILPSSVSVSSPTTKSSTLKFSFVTTKGLTSPCRALTRRKARRKRLFRRPFLKRVSPASPNALPTRLNSSTVNSVITSKRESKPAPVSGNTERCPTRKRKKTTVAEGSKKYQQVLRHSPQGWLAALHIQKMQSKFHDVGHASVSTCRQYS